MKKGQITVFLIAGILIFLSIFVVYLIRGYVIKGAIEPGIYEGMSLPDQLNSVNQYVQFCIRQESEPSIKRIALFGGTFETGNRIEYLGENINVLCRQVHGKGCIQSQLLREKIEDELSQLIKQRLFLCLDLSKFIEKGYELTYNPLELNVDVSIAVNDVNVIVDYPITLKRGTSTLKSDQHIGKITLPIGRMHDLAVDIVNSEVEKGYFDKDERMAKDSSIIIEKHKPYPNTVYSLNANGIEFKFAIAGIDTVGKYPPDLKPEYGCCIIKEDMCYMNVAPESCTGRYEKDCSCKPRALQLEQEQNAGCGDRKHGESWCEYDGIDNVGSRHYLHSCVNGKEIIEECRDYREELCTEQDGKAVCRINRWQDCYKCETPGCCGNTELRDCEWLNINTEKKCVPAVAPGLKFWESSQVCAAGNERKATSAGDRQWIDSTVELCYSLGDCGNYYNLAGELTKNGFVNTAGRESQSVYVFERQGKITLPMDTRTVAKVAGEGEYPDSSMSAQHLSDFLNYINHINSYASEINESSEDSGQGMYFSRCNAWTAPVRTDDCKLCDAGGRICSEYVCKSLDESCIYTEALGMPKCETPSTIDRSAPRIFIDEEALIQGYSAANANINNWYDGYEIVPEIRPHSPITFGIKTSEDTRCKITYLPENEFRVLPPYWFGDSGYNLHHNITIRLPAVEDIADNLITALNLSSLEDILDLPGFMMQPIAKLAALKLLDEFKQGRYYVFVKCNDKSGNVNEQEFFIKFTINQSYADEPVIEATIPENDAVVPFGTENVSVMVYVNKPALCRASFEDAEFDEMELEFSCAQSEYEMSAVAGGTYLCEAALQFSEAYYIRCSDKGSTNRNSYILYLKQADELRIIKTEPSGEIGVTYAVLAVETSGKLEDEVECSYSSGAEYIAMDRADSLFTAQASGLEENRAYDYDVVCKDKYGNEASSVIVFSVIV